ncbi:partial Aerobic respiration control sensor protein ArcB, partial [uncultured bacterium]
MIIKASGYRVLLLNVVLAGVYFLLAEFGLLFATTSGNVTLIWLPAGLALAVFLLGGVHYIPCIFLGAFAAGIAVGDSILISLGIALGNTLEPLFAWYLLTRLIKFDIFLNRLVDFLLLLFFAAPLSSLVSTIISISSLFFGGLINTEQLKFIALSWWMADTLGIILVTPLILAWLKPWPCLSKISISQKILRTLPVLFTFLAGQILFLDWFKEDIQLIAKPELMFLFISWVAMTLRTRGVTLVLVITAVQALIGARLGIGYFANDFIDTHLLHLWFYFLTLTVVGVTLATYINEHHEGKNALQESENRFRHLLQDIPSVAVQSYNKDGKILYWTKASERLYGYTSEEAIGRDIAELLIPAKTQNSYKYAIREMFKTEQPTSSMELSLTSKDGSLVEVFIYHAFVRQGAEPEIFCMAINMTEYKHVEALSRRNENYLKSLLNTIPDFVWLKDTNGVYLFCNPIFERFLGAKTSNIIGKTDYDFVNDEQANFFRESDLTTIAKGTPHTVEQAIKFADDNKEALLEVTRTPMYSEDGELIGVLGIAHDVTEHKQIEERLRASESRLRSIIDVSPVPMALSDKQHHITFLNPAFEQTL